MGWQTDLVCRISFDNKTYNDLYEVEEDIATNKKIVQDAKKQLHDLAIMTEPKKFFNEEDGEILWQIQKKVDECLEIIDDYMMDLHDLYLLRDNWDNCHNKDGLAKAIPKDFEWNTAYLDGDFIKTDENPNADKYE